MTGRSRADREAVLRTIAMLSATATCGGRFYSDEELAALAVLWDLADRPEMAGLYRRFAGLRADVERLRAEV